MAAAADGPIVVLGWGAPEPSWFSRLFRGCWVRPLGEDQRPIDVDGVELVSREFVVLTSGARAVRLSKTGRPVMAREKAIVTGLRSGDVLVYYPHLFVPLSPRLILCRDGAERRLHGQWRWWKTYANADEPLNEPDASDT